MIFSLLEEFVQYDILQPELPLFCHRKLKLSDILRDLTPECGQGSHYIISCLFIYLFFRFCMMVAPNDFALVDKLMKINENQSINPSNEALLLWYQGSCTTLTFFLCLEKNLNELGFKNYIKLHIYYRRCASLNCNF